MFHEFGVSNFHSFRDAECLRAESEGRENVHTAPAIAVRGGNGAGKSSLVQAFAFLKELVAGDPGRALARTVAFITPSRRLMRPTEFSIEFSAGDNRYEYRIATKGGRVVKEKLLLLHVYISDKDYAEGIPDLIFDRLGLKGDRVAFGRLFGEEARKDALEAVEKGLPIAAAPGCARHCECVADAVKFFSSMRVVDLELPDTSSISLPRGIKRGKEVRAALVSYLSSIDPAVKGIVIKTGDAELLDRVMVRRDAPGGKMISVPLRSESVGFRKMLSLYSAITGTLEDGGVLIIDGLGSGLHPELCSRVAALFAGGKTNRNGAQLVFTTHDTAGLRLSGPKAPACWFVDKRGDGSSHLYSLARLKGRGKEGGAREKAYLEGKYGATPAKGRIVVPTGRG